MKELERYNKVFISIFEVDAELLNDDFAYGQIKKWDSITHLSLVTSIEDEFDLMLDSEDILDFMSYESGKKIMAKYDILV